MMEVDTATLTEIEAELTLVCNVAECGSTPEWVVWARHPVNHEPVDGLLCTPHKESCERRWVESLTLNLPCTCGHVYKGQLSENFRMVRL